MKFIDVIDEDFDTSLHFNFTDLGVLEGEHRKIAKSQPALKVRIDDFIDETQTFQYNFTNIESLNRMLSSKILPRKEFNKQLIDSTLAAVENLPRYRPPSKQQTLAFKIYTEAYLRNGKTHYVGQRAPIKPKVPRAKTNTNLANYIHKLYMYEQHLKRELKDHTLNSRNRSNSIERDWISFHQVGRAASAPVFSILKSSPLGAISGSDSSTDSTVRTTSSGEEIILRHKYDPELGRSIARSLSRKSGRVVSI